MCYSAAVKCLSCGPREPQLTDRDVLEEYDKKMRDAENDSHEGKRKVESVWCVLPPFLLSGGADQSSSRIPVGFQPFVLMSADVLF